MFPAVHTLWLLLVVVALNIIGTVVLLVQVRAMGKALHLKKDWPPLCQDWDSPAFKGLHAGGKIGNALQAAQISWLHMVATRIDVLDLFLKAICFCKRNSDVFARTVRQDCI